LNIEQFNNFLLSCDIRLSPGDVQKNFDFYDRDGDGKVSTAEIRKHMHINQYGLNGPRSTSTRAIFDRFSADKGYMTPAELQNFYASIGSPMSNEQLATHLRQCNITNGRIDANQFGNFVRLG
jgi:Ca2+-binding EF-hand superfamily protein